MNHSHFIPILHMGSGKSNFSHFQGTFFLGLFKGPGAYRVKKFFDSQPLLCSSASPWSIPDDGDI